jgi:hypothetical protein
MNWLVRELGTFMFPRLISVNYKYVEEASDLFDFL